MWPRKSSAPHVARASLLEEGLSFWGGLPGVLGGPAEVRGLLLHDTAGLWRLPPGLWPLSFVSGMLCYFTSGEAFFEGEPDEFLALPGTVAHIPQGWKGVARIRETLGATFMLSDATPPGTALLARAAEEPARADWGPVPTLLEGASHTSGILLARKDDGHAESGIWICTPGTWACHVTDDEFCHFLAGRCTYLHESGEAIDVEPDTAAFFPAGWRGICTVRETVRKVYHIR